MWCKVFPAAMLISPLIITGRDARLRSKIWKRGWNTWQHSLTLFLIQSKIGFWNFLKKLSSRCFDDFPLLFSRNFTINHFSFKRKSVILLTLAISKLKVTMLNVLKENKKARSKCFDFVPVVNSFYSEM